MAPETAEVVRTRNAPLSMMNDMVYECGRGLNMACHVWLACPVQLSPAPGLQVRGEESNEAYSPYPCSQKCNWLRVQAWIIACAPAAACC